ncbi:ABC transporter ATP-binding protein [Ulvibacter antarcticus]|uniref:Iron complex transport system ATP-binding protein n=1 Tax=Ulvibacter antarcticus TaxID=442714 RepID=A0A3L9YV64_9FLAO|nr:ABC transporter ATP-binding protein [Ulvibacter antarcticus]RMA64631.1 iron complex transport system ATP-binding protein [Ulvibacter antarcticus]
MASEEKHIILETRDLAVGYTSKRKSDVIASGISFSVSEGELVALVGANGIGKSTLLRSLAGMQASLKGEIFLKGKRLSEYGMLQMANELSVVLTETPASKNLTVLELISLGRQPHTNWMGTLSEEDKKAIKFALEATNTETLAQSKCYELSDGQLQRVYIARALAQDTTLIILDEPTTHLDLYHRAYVLKLLKKLANETGKAILYSTHEIDLAIQLSDKMLVMTHETCYFDRPKNLIADGRFDSLFPTETIDFDKNSGRFTIKE